MPRYTTREEDYGQGTQPHPGRKGLLMEKTRTIRSGDWLEVEIFPIVDVETGVIRDRKRKKSPEAVRRINERNAVKRLERLMNCNFGPGDLLPHLTMAKSCTFEEMQKTVRNFVKRLQRRAKKQGVALRYIYVIETTGEGNRQKHHVHMCVNGGWISREEMESMWRWGLARVDRCQRMEKGLAGFANYITQRKETQKRLMQRRWGASKGLKQPQITENKRKFSRRACEKIARGVMEDARAIFEKQYPGFRLIEQPLIRWSEFLPGCYIYAMMERTPGQNGDKQGANAHARAWAD